MNDAEWEAASALIYRRAYEQASISGGYFNAADLATLTRGDALLAEGLARGLFVCASDSVFRLATLGRHPLEGVIVAWLEVGRGASVSHQSALALWGLAPAPPRVQLTVRPGIEADASLRLGAGASPSPQSGADASASPRPGVDLYIAELSADDRFYVGPVRATSVERALADCAAVGAPASLLDEAREKARRKKLIVGAAPAITSASTNDPTLHLALLGALRPAAELARETEGLDPDKLRAWALSQEGEEPEGEPLEELFWNDSSPLWTATHAPLAKLDGLEPFTALRTIVLRGSCVESLAPLEALSELVTLELGVASGVALDPLLRCPSLRRVRLRGVPSAEGHAGVQALRNAGTLVDLADAPARPKLGPFADPMLKLAILEHLADQKAIELPDLIVIDEFELDPENLARLLDLDLPADRLRQVERLAWSAGGHRIQHRVWPQFDGESDEFTVRSLVGLEALPALKQLYLSPLAAVPASEIEALRQRGVEISDPDAPAPDG